MKRFDKIKYCIVVDYVLILGSFYVILLILNMLDVVMILYK